MADYAKKKNDELAALCKERGLAHTGKKAELVKRLEEHDAKSGNTDATVKDDEASSNARNTAAGTQQTASEPVEQPGESKESTNDDTSKATEPAQSETTQQNFALGLQETTLDEEIAKRKKRAEKFGLDISQDETLKLLERAKRFGSNNVPGLLNQALPERAERKKRGREGRDEKDDRKRSRQRGNQDRPQKEKETKSDGPPSWMTDKDREAAERRKAKFTRSD